MKKNIVHTIENKFSLFHCLFGLETCQIYFTFKKFITTFSKIFINFWNFLINFWKILKKISQKKIYDE